MKKVLILVAVLILGVFAYKHFVKSGSSDSVVSYVPEDTVLFMGNLEAVDATDLMAWTASMTVDPTTIPGIMQVYEEGADTKGLQFLLSFYVKYLKGLSDLDTFFEKFGLDKTEVDGAFYMVQSIPVMRWQVADSQVFEKLIGEIETEIDYSAEKETKGNVSFRRYQLNEKQPSVDLIVAQQENHVVFTLNTPLDDEQDLFPALGINKPEKSIQNSAIFKGAMSEINVGSIGVLFFNTLEIVKGLTNPEANRLGDMLKLFAELAEEPSDGLSKIQTPACQKEFAEMAARWPYISGGYTELTKEKATYKMLTKMTDNNFIDSLKKLAGSVPTAYSNKELPFYMALGINVNYLTEFVTDLKADWSKRTYECEPLAEMKMSIENMNTVFLMTAGMMQNVKGLGVGVTKMADIEALKNSDFSGLSVVSTIIADKPESLINLAKGFFPPLQEINLTNDGVAHEISVPMAPMPVKVAMKESQITLFTDDLGKDFIDSEAQEGYFLGFGADYALLGQLMMEADFDDMPNAEKDKEMMENLFKSLDYYVDFSMSIEDRGLMLDTHMKRNASN